MSLLLLLIAHCIISTVSSNYFRTGDEYDEVKVSYLHVPSKHDAHHDVMIAVKQHNVEYLKHMLMQISDPTNEFYGQHMTREEVGMITANKRSIHTISRYLRARGVHIVRQSPYGEYITCRASLELWENIFNTTFYRLNFLDRKKDDAKQYYRAKEYSIPFEIAPHVIDVFNTIQIPPENVLGNLHIRAHLSSKNSTDDDQPTTITPAILNKYYDIDSNSGHSKVSQSLFESLGQYYSDRDLHQFQDQYAIPRSDVALSLGMHESANFCLYVPYQCSEANLDVQYLMAISQNTPTTMWYQPPIGDDIFLSWIESVSSNPTPPLVHSISYGALERDLPISYANAFNIEAIKLALQGVTIVASSGDDGVGNFRARYPDC